MRIHKILMMLVTDHIGDLIIHRVNAKIIQETKMAIQNMVVEEIIIDLIDITVHKDSHLNSNTWNNTHAGDESFSMQIIHFYFERWGK